MSKITVGVDVGGTNIKLGLITNQGKITARSNLGTQDFAKSKNKLISAIISSINDLLTSRKISKKDICGICFGLPGLVDPQKGVVKLLPNIPGWKNVPLKKIVQKETGIKTFLDNDVNLITLGEWKFGAGKGFANLMCLTLGTGVGAGLILNNAIYRGEGYVAGELGHMPLNERGPDCNCGGYGCFERYVGNQSLMDKAAKIFKTKNIKLEEVYALAEQENARAVQFWEETGTHIGNGLVGVVNLLNPRLIIIGGGVSKSYKYMKDIIKNIVAERSMKVQAKMVKIVRAKLGDNASIIGAQVFVHNHKARI